jgi:hypothetical protein
MADHTLHPAGQESESHKVDWLVLSRMVIFIISLMCLGFYFGSLGTFYRYLLTPSDQVMYGYSWSANQLHAALQASGLTLQFYALNFTVVIGLFGLVSGGSALFLLYRKPDNPMAVYVALTLVLFGTGFPPLVGVMAALLPNLKWLISTWTLSGFTLLFILFLIFPDGKFVPRWASGIAILWTAGNAISIYWPASRANFFAWPTPWDDIFFFGFFAFFVLAQVYRYLRVSNLVERLQTKWVTAGMIVALGGFFLPNMVAALRPELRVPGVLGIRFDLLQTYIYVFSFMMIPFSLRLAIIRHRLWDIDLIIRRTIYYTLLTATLLVVFFGSVILLQLGINRFTRFDNSQIATVLSTLMIAALFNPLRRRIQRDIDRRFYRQKYDATRLLAEFNDSLRDNLDLEDLKNSFSTIIEKTMQPATQFTWFKPATSRSETKEPQ